MFLLTSFALPYHGLRYRPTGFECFFEVIRWQVATFQLTAGSSSIFKMHMKLVVFMRSTLISNWRRTREFNRLLHAGKAIAFDFSHCHALITFYVQLLCSDIGQHFYRWVNAENLCSVWLIDSGSCDVLNCLFLLDVQNEIQLLSRLFCNSWLVCLLRFLLTNALLVKVIGNPISGGITCPCLGRIQGWKVSSDSGALDDLQKQHLDW